jgi:3-carboxy-cis,cis-muconate cycloisomerase
MIVLPTFDPGFTTPEMTEVFDPDHRVEALLAFEAALAEAEAETGLIPAPAAKDIVRACSEFAGDAVSVIASTWDTGTPLIALRGEISRNLSEESAGWIHYGATTQDAVDTASMLQIKAALTILDRDVSAVAARLADLAEAHRATPMMARTFLQRAQPTTFGVRVAQWLEPLVRALVNLREITPSLPVQLGGPVGNLAPFGEAGQQIVETLAARLGLASPVIAWHTDRSHVIRPVAMAEIIAIATGKIGTDLALLAQSDVAELTMRPGASSSMGHKRNPIDAIRAVAAAGACLAAASALRSGNGQELERGIGGWHLEWWAVPLVFQSAAASVEAISAALGSLEVDIERMKSRSGELDAVTRVAAAHLVERVLAVWRDLA